MAIKGVILNSESAAGANRVAIQAAIDAGGLVDLGPGKCFIDGALKLRNSLRITGSNANETEIHQLNPAEDVLRGTDILDLVIENLSLWGTGAGSGPGRGIYLAQNTRSSNRVTIRSVNLIQCGSDGFKADHLVVSTLEKANANTCGGNGFTLSRGTSVGFASTWAVACSGIGYDLQNMTYCDFSATAVDYGKTGYRFKGCSGITLTGCGVESIDGPGVVIDTSTGIVLNALQNYDNHDCVVYVTGQSSDIEINRLREGSAALTATASIRVDPRCIVAIRKGKLLSPLALSPKTTTFPDSIYQAVKSQDTYRTTGTLDADPDLDIYLQDPLSTWLVEGTLIYSAASGVDVRLAWNGPAGATFNWSRQALASVLTVALTPNAVSTLGDSGALLVGGAGKGTRVAAQVRGVLRLAKATGDFSLRWAQGTSNSQSSAVLHADSYLQMQRVS